MNTWPLGYCTTQLESQNRKFVPISIITGPKNDHFFVCKQTGFVNQRLWDFAKMTLTQVSSHWLWLESNRVIMWKTWLESSQHLSQRDSSLVRVTKIVTRVESSRWLESCYHWLLLPVKLRMTELNACKNMSLASRFHCMCNYSFCFEVYVNNIVFVAWFDFSIFGWMHNLKQTYNSILKKVA